MRTPDLDTQILQPETSSQEMPVLQDLNEDENEMMLTLPYSNFANSLAISYSPFYYTASKAIDIILRPPKA